MAWLRHTVAASATATVGRPQQSGAWSIEITSTAVACVAQCGGVGTDAVFSPHASAQTAAKAGVPLSRAINATQTNRGIRPFMP